MAQEEELAALRKQLDAYRDRVPPAEPLRQFMRISREARVKNPEDVARFGATLLRHHKAALAEEERWLLHEQAAVAALEVGALPVAAGLARAVLERFPDSVRARRLQGLYYEAAGKLERAEEVYAAALRDAPSNEIMAKRMVALAKTRGQPAAAIEALVAYLAHYANDREAWEELGDLYCDAGLYRQAAFAYEEVLTTAAASPPAYVRYADALYCLGGAAALRTARTYYARAVSLSAGRSSRALFGLVAACAALGADGDGGARGTRPELPAAAAEQLLALYAESAPALLPAAREALARMGAVPAGGDGGGGGA